MMSSVYDMTGAFVSSQRLHLSAQGQSSHHFSKDGGGAHKASSLAEELSAVDDCWG